MDIPKRLTRVEAEAMGFTVNTQTYPWLAAIPQTEDAPVEVYTDLEAALLRKLAQERLPAEETLTYSGIRGMFRQLEGELAMGHEDEALTRYTTETVVDATHYALMNSGYSMTDAAMHGDEVPFVDMSAVRRFGRDKEYLANMTIQVGADELILSGKIVHADKPHVLYDEDAHVFIRVRSVSQKYVELVRELRAALDAVVARVAATEGFTL